MPSDLKIDTELFADVINNFDIRIKLTQQQAIARGCIGVIGPMERRNLVITTLHEFALALRGDHVAKLIDKDASLTWIVCAKCNEFSAVMHMDGVAACRVCGVKI